MADKNKAIQDQIDALIKEIKDGEPSDEIEAEINTLQAELDAQKESSNKQELQDKLDALQSAISDTNIGNNEAISGIFEAIRAIELPTPQVTVQPPEVTVNVPEIKVPETKIPPIQVPKPQVNFPESFSIKRPTWLPKIDLSPITRAIDKLIGAIPQVKWPTDAKDAIPVRLSDGKKFYVAIATAATAISDILTFKTADGAKAAALVDETGIVQVKDAALATSIDSLEGILTNIASYTDGLETLLTAIQGYVDTLETKLQSVIDNTDQLEGYVDGLETLGTALNGYVDGLEGLLATPTTPYNGKKTVTTAGTRVTLASSQAVKSVTIKALATNTGLIYVGDSSVSSSNGYQLSAGESISIDIANLNTVNLDSSVSGESVTYIGVN